MRTLFDFDYLRKDLSANANIRSEIERARSFVKLNNTVRAKSILEQLTDKHPESPCAWFARAEIASEDFNRVDLLEKVATHEQYNKITKYLTNAIKMADANRKLLYSDLLNIYSLRCMESLADSFTAKLGYIVDSFEEVERVSIPKCPENCAMQRWISFSVSNLFDDLITNSQGTFYELPDDLISSVGARFPSVLLVNLHRKLMAKYIYPYSKAKREYNEVREAHNSCYRYSLAISKRYGTSYEKSVEIAEEKANREHPLYADWSYYPYSIESDYTFADFLKEKLPELTADNFDPRIKTVLLTYLRMLKVINIPVGDLTACGLAVYLDDELNAECAAVKEVLQNKRAQWDEWQKEWQRKKKEKEEKQAAEKKEREETEKRKNRKFILLILFVIFGIPIIAELIWLCIQVLL